MTRIRRLKNVERPVYFVTTNTFERRRIFGDPEFAGVATRNIYHLEERGDVKNFAFVVMPDHVHVLFEIMCGKTVSEIMHDVKSHIAHELSSISHRQGCHALAESENTFGRNQPTRSVAASGMSRNIAASGMATERKYVRVWQRSFYDHVVMDDRDLWTHIEYIKNNPIRAGLVRALDDYSWLFVRATVDYGSTRINSEK